MRPDTCPIETSEMLSYPGRFPGRHFEEIGQSHRWWRCSKRVRARGVDIAGGSTPKLALERAAFSTECACIPRGKRPVSTPWRTRPTMMKLLAAFAAHSLGA